MAKSRLPACDWLCWAAWLLCSSKAGYHPRTRGRRRSAIRHVSLKLEAGEMKV